MSARATFVLPKRYRVSLLLACARSAQGDVTELPVSRCRSNATHISWTCGKRDGVNYSTERWLQSTDDDCSYQERGKAEVEALSYLRDNVMAFDVPNMETLGFSDGGTDSDGLGDGLVGHTVKLALDTKAKYPWADDVPKDVYYEYVLNYANLNEPRTNWRPLFTDALRPTIESLPLNSTTVNDVVKTVNSHLWRALGQGDRSIVFKGGQTPLIFDPMSVVAFGYCSCTGTAIMLVNALRATGVPARVVGTPAWKGVRENGNHNWIEVYHQGIWDFLEPSTPTDPSVEVVPNADDLKRDPCNRWFCNSNSQYGKTRVYAARLDKRKSTTHCPLAWEWESTDVPGEDRTHYYVEKCTCDGDN